MHTHVFRYPVKSGQPFRRFLCSDLHLGSVNADVARLRRELEAASDMGARIFINGDVFDAITSGDKRYQPGDMVPALANKKDVLAAMVKYAAEILAPYRHLIEVIGIGNHEQTVIKYRGADPVAALIDALNARLAEDGSSHRIRHGGISGFVVTQFAVESGESTRVFSHKMHYHHGSGGDAPVTLGSITFARKDVAFDYDCVTFGHKHNSLRMEKIRTGVTSQGELTFRRVHYVQTGSYYRNYRACTQDEPIEASYAEHFEHPAKPLGGRVLVLWLDQRGGRWTIHQDDHGPLTPQAMVTA